VVVADGEGAALAGEEGGAAVDGDCTGADCAAGAEFEHAVMNAVMPRAETSSAAVRLARLFGAGRRPACPHPGTVPGRR
jgi:hypothetical protein